MVIKILCAMVSSFGFGGVFQIRGKKLLYGAISGGIAYWIYLLFLGRSSVLASFLASCAITLYAEIMARRLKSPATVFLVAGLIPIVPGGGMYRCMYQALEGSLSLAAVTCYTTLLEAGAVAIGVVTVSSLVKITNAILRLNRKPLGAK